MALDILVVDDEARHPRTGRRRARGRGLCGPRPPADSDAALDAIAERRPSLVLLDVWLQGSRLDGLELLDEIKRRDPTMPVLVISGHGNLDTAVAAIRAGRGRLHREAVRGRAAALLVDARDRDRAAAARESRRCARRSASETELTGSRAAINDVRATLKRVAATGSRVLITGPAGRRQGSRRAAAPQLEPARRRRRSSSSAPRG